MHAPREVTSWFANHGSALVRPTETCSSRNLDGNGDQMKNLSANNQTVEKENLLKNMFLKSSPGQRVRGSSLHFCQSEVATLLVTHTSDGQN